jgi:nucleoside-diphosphate-sugar epimerase
MLSGYENKTVFITGATGFIGGRLSEVLVTECKAHVKALVRDFSTAIRIGRLPIEICRGDVTKIEEVQQAIKGADFVFHCAYGNKGDTKDRCGTTILGTEIVLKAALAEKIQSFVFLSTQSVYGNPNAEWIDEDTPKKPKGDQYAQSKLRAERIVQRYCESGLKTIIIQPTAVYGPWAPSYGKRVFDQLHESVMPLIDGGLGICNAVYIDDLVYAILLAAINEKAYGHCFLINGTEYCTWRQFWGYFEKIIGKERTKSIGKKAALRLHKKSQKRPSLVRLFRIDPNVVYEFLKIKWFFKIFFIIKKIVPKRLYLFIKRKMILGVPVDQLAKEKNIPDAPFIIFDPTSIDFFTSKTKVRIKKAIEILDYRPRFPLSAGFAKTEQWYKWFYGRR